MADVKPSKPHNRQYRYPVNGIVKVERKDCTNDLWVEFVDGEIYDSFFSKESASWYSKNRNRPVRFPGSPENQHAWLADLNKQSIEKWEFLTPQPCIDFIYDTPDSAWVKRSYHRLYKSGENAGAYISDSRYNCIYAKDADANTVVEKYRTMYHEPAAEIEPESTQKIESKKAPDILPIALTSLAISLGLSLAKKRTAASAKNKVQQLKEQVQEVRR